MGFDPAAAGAHAESEVASRPKQPNTRAGSAPSSAYSSKLAVKGAKVGTLAVATPNIYSYYANLPGGGYAVLLANADPANAYTLSTSSLGVTGSGTEYLYDSAHPTISTSAFSGTSVSVPAQRALRAEFLDSACRK